MHSTNSARRVRTLEATLFGGIEPTMDDPSRCRDLEEPFSGPCIGTIEYDPKTQKVTFYRVGEKENPVSR